jgi:hypothetical protein
MKDDEGKGLGSTIPNEETIPHLHAFTFKRNQLVNNNNLLKQSEITNTYLTEHSAEITEAKEKLLAIFKMLF